MDVLVDVLVAGEHLEADPAHDGIAPRAHHPVTACDLFNAVLARGADLAVLGVLSKPDL